MYVGHTAKLQICDLFVTFGEATFSLYFIFEGIITTKHSFHNCILFLNWAKNWHLNSDELITRTFPLPNHKLSYNTASGTWTMMGFSISLPKICHCHILLTPRASHFPDIMHHCLVAKNANYEKSNHVQETEKKPRWSLNPSEHTGLDVGLSQLGTTTAHRKPVGQPSITRAHIPCPAQTPQISKSIFDLDSSDKTHEFIQRSKKKYLLRADFGCSTFSFYFSCLFFTPTNKTSGIKGTKENTQNLKLSC